MTTLTQQPVRRKSRGRILLLVLAGASLLAGLDAALLLVGVWAPVDSSRLPGLHGMVMVLGFMGSLIALERAQALGRAWGYLAPVVMASGALSLVFGAPVLLGKLLLVQGCILLVAVYVALWRRAPVTMVAVQVLSAVLALCGAALWLVVSIDQVLIWLAGFIVLTIAAERAELAQLTMGPGAPNRLLALSGLLSAAIIVAMVWPPVGARVFGLAVVGFVAWLLRDDVARKFIRASGLRRYNAAALLAGYVWLGLAGAVWLVGGIPDAQASYDIAIHGTFLGFGMSMIMAHAPIIFPAVLGRPLPYRKVSWLPLVLLHLGMLGRVTGDLTGHNQLWQVGSVVTVVAVLVFLIVSVLLVVTHRGPR
ncbi:MAG: hypothetical protein ACOX61_04720 [Brooklawnia sp.]|jgi:hypothetical protein